MRPKSIPTVVVVFSPARPKSSTPRPTEVMIASVVSGSISEMEPTKVVLPAAKPPEMTIFAGRARPAKIVISGGFAAGKTTFVGSISEIEPLTTEAIMTSVGRGVDDFGRAGLKTTTTVGIDFGRITVAPDLVLYLFGTPGQGRFFFAWDELTRGA